MVKTTDLANMNMNATEEIVNAGQYIRKEFILNNIIPKKNSKKHKERLCHIHDLEYYDICYNCLGVRVADLIGKEKRNFRKMLTRLLQAIVELTNLQSGGIGFIDFDTDLAYYLEGGEKEEEIVELLQEFFSNLNMYTRKGCEKPYVTFNFGLNTSVGGRKATFLLLEAFKRGDENAQAFIFPNLVFKLKSQVNIMENSPNHDLYIEALKVTAQKMIPTFFNCDSISNKNFNSDEIGIMGCRTRVTSNVNGKEGAVRRGNIACVTLNLPQISYRSNRDMGKFYSLLEENLGDAKEVLLHRLTTLSKSKLFNDKFFEKNYYLDSDKKDPEILLKNGTFSIGFIGLWDCISVLVKEEINSVEKIQKYFSIAYDIVKFMREYTDKITKIEKLNFSLLASAAEGVTGNFATYDAEYDGKEYVISRKGYYTNSFHVPVSIEINYKNKINIENEFHGLCNGGSITYIELKEIPGKNFEAVKEIVDYAYTKDCNYIGINFPLDNCIDCGYIGKIFDCCPKCNSKKIRKLRRVSGYLSEENNFTSGKRKELSDRKNHS